MNFTDHGKKITYNTWSRYEYVESMSNGSQHNDVVWNVNPAYLAVLAKTGGEIELWIAFAGPSLEFVLDFLRDTFAWDQIAAASPALLAAKQRNLTESLKVPNATQVFYQLWANSTYPPTAAWKVHQ